MARSSRCSAVSIAERCRRSNEGTACSRSTTNRLSRDETGLALENSRLMATIVSEIAKREWIGREIDIARGVQQRLFPQSLPHVADVECAGVCRPAQGIPAALLMASLQASLRGQRMSGPADLLQLMTNLNFLIHEASPDDRYATFFYGEIDPKSRRLDCVNAGQFERRSVALAPGAIQHDDMTVVAVRMTA